MGSGPTWYVEERPRLRTDPLMCEGDSYPSIWDVKTLVRTFGPPPRKRSSTMALTSSFTNSRVRSIGIAGLA
jgi:hypothetical protein